ncbi:dTMP kinase [Shewanella algae]
MPGKFIVITGLDGSGTSSIGQKLAEMDENGYYLQTPEGVFSEYREQFTQALRDSDPEAHYLYYLASVVKASNEIKKKLETHNVYCVRFLIDTVVSHRAMGVDVDLVYDLGFVNIVKPDLILYIDVNENIRQLRITERGKSILDKKLDDKEFRDRFQAEFSRFASQLSIIDNSTSLDTCLSIAKMQIDALLSKNLM